MFEAIKDTLERKDEYNTERFFFIMNLSDKINVKEFDDISENISEYLIRHFKNENINIFYTSAYYALLIRQKLSGFTLDESDDEELNQYVAKKFKTFLPDYSSISYLEKEKLNSCKIVDVNDDKKTKLEKALQFKGLPVL